MAHAHRSHPPLAALYARTVTNSGARSARPRGRARVAQRLQRSVGALSTAALARMETDIPWVADLDAQDRSMIGLVLQSGIRGFVDWYRGYFGQK